ncbi:sensor domain-containing diguanylate cyclase [Roseovarius tibetensis]|uniref:sensor domain-containing diguanylate cyclase n=1 Tax=Roseovarius tibetensis TaxID=2685897 RepID=UPI003D7F46DB
MSQKTTPQCSSWLGIFQAAVEAAYDAVLITDAELELPGPRIVYVNPAFSRMTGYSLDEIIGKTPRIMQGPETDWSVIRRLRDDLEHDRTFEGKSKNYRKDGSAFIMEWTIAPVLDEDDQVTHYVALQRDVTERERLLEMLQHQALFDGLTGALNRTETERLLSIEVEGARRYNGPLSMIMFDIDNFKAVNDKYGHNVGDEVLRRIAQAVLSRMRTVDYFGRWGGEEFAVLLPQTSLDGAKALAEDLRALIEGLEFDDDLKVTASFGVAARLDETEATALIERADRALYVSKDSGRNQVSVASGDQ